MGRLDDILFVIREDTLAKRLAYVPCFASLFHLGSNSDEEMEFERGYHRSKAGTGGPVCWVKISEDNDAIFCSIWVSMFVFFDF